MRYNSGKRKKNYVKLSLWYLKHIFFRLRHYGALIISMPSQQLDYILGMFCYRRSPFFGRLPYAEFVREHGRYGEFQLWRRAKRKVGKNAVWFHNLYLPKKDGTTCEVDLIAVSTRGIFVFESKNYNGWIFGSEDKPYWYQLVRHDLRKPPQKFSFFNPVMQNAMHCRCLCQLLPEVKENVHSFVVFGNRCKLREIKRDGSKTVICKQGRMGRYIRKHPVKILAPSDVINISDKLMPYIGATYTEKIRHITEIQNKKKEIYN